MKILLLATVLWALFIILDLIWFYFMGNFFKAEIGSIARLNEAGGWDVNLVAGALVYVLMTIGLLVFVLPLAGSLPQALMYGALFGFVAYGIYDLTNMATLSAWTVRFAAVDMTWGTFLCGTVAACGYLLSKLPFFTTT